MNDDIKNVSGHQFFIYTKFIEFWAILVCLVFGADLRLVISILTSFKLINLYGCSLA